MSIEENNKPTSGKTLVALSVAEDAAVAVARIMTGLPAGLRIYQDQAIRAAASAALNVAEGAGRGGRDRKRTVARICRREVGICGSGKAGSRGWLLELRRIKVEHVAASATSRRRVTHAHRGGHGTARL